MMKKLIALVLALLLVLGLWGCDGAAQDGPSAQNKPGSHPSSVENDNTPENTEGPAYAMKLRFTINPEFILYLDKAQNILSVEAVNDDAKVLLFDMKIAGTPYTQAITTILDAAYTYGYLKDGGRITVGVELQQPVDEAFGAIAAPISQFTASVGITAETSVGLELDIPDVNDQTAVLNGQTVYLIHIPVCMQGGIEIAMSTVFATEKTFPPNNPYQYAIQSITQYYNGDMAISYFQDGIMTKEFVTYADGSTNEIFYHSEGWVISQRITQTNGDYLYFRQNKDYERLEYEEYENGVYSDRHIMEDGTILETTIEPNGHREIRVSTAGGTGIRWERYEPNGSYCLVTYHDNGNIKEQESLIDGVHNYITSGENGNLISDKIVYANGDYSIWYYFPSGQTKAYEGLENGTVSLWTNYENGNISYSETRSPDGSYNIQYYYSNGAIQSSESLVNGQYSKIEYDMNGSIISETSGN